MPDKDKNGGVQIPADLKGLSPEDLDAFETGAADEFDTLTNDEGLDATGLARATELADGIEMVRGERTARETAAAELAAQRDALKSRVHSEPADEADATEVDETAEEGAPAEAALVAAGRKAGDTIRTKSANKLNVRLSDAAKRQGSTGTVPLAQQFDASVLVASADIPGIGHGAPLTDMAALIEAYQKRARSLAIGRAFAHQPKIHDKYLDASTGKMAFGLVGHEGDWRDANRVPVASMQRNFRHILNDQSTPDQAWKVMQEAANQDSLVAAGGWCSPSEIRYDFYNIVAMDGALDLPTTGISRGGMRWPTSPSFGDLASSTGLWHWTEFQDIAAATGAGAGLKTCARVPCASFNEVRLEGEGVCISAGNLTTDAWPEQLANFLRLVNAAHYHRVNAFFVNSIIAQSTPVTLTQTNGSPTTDILGGIEHQVWDLRTKYAMADTDVLEVVLPSWVKGLIRTDVARRSGLADLNNSFIVTDSQIASWFTQRYVSVQFIQDFDVRGTNQFGQSTPLSAAWPATVRFLIYPAGTWLRGNGLNLDLGIIRDSTLNATNDYTAAWSEEFFSLAKIGHESRIVTLGASGVTPTGTTAVGLTATGV